ncbi:MAG: hypothetical protein ACP5PZ_11640 [Bacteroidales bacterium]
MRQVDIILQYELGVNPDELTDEEWAAKYNDLVWYLTLRNRTG